jgi:predicted nucleotidyltransferase
VDDHYRKALAAAMADITADPEVIGVLFTGSIQQGRAQATSDLDLYVVTHKDHYWRATRRYEGVETELFINNVASMKWRITRPDEIAATAGFATGEILLDRTGELAELQVIARERWEAGPRPVSENQIVLLRYALTDLADDLADVADDPVASRVQGAALVSKATDAYCKLNRHWGDKPKRLVAYIAERDEVLGEMLKDYYSQGLPATTAFAVVDYVLASVGGRLHEWESEKVTYQGG